MVANTKLIKSEKPNSLHLFKGLNLLFPPGYQVYQILAMIIITMLD